MTQLKYAATAHVHDQDHDPEAAICHYAITVEILLIVISNHT